MRMKLATLLLVLFSVASSASQKESTVWDRLSHDEGWVVLGGLDMPTNKCATSLDYEVVDLGGRETPLIPQVGDVLRFGMDVEVVVLSFTTRGESRAGTFPGERVLTAEDIVGILKVGSRVRVRRIEREKPIGPMQLIWALVSPDD